MGYRFRVDEGKLVLQVYVPPKIGQYNYDRDGTWRDAKVEDIPVTDPFQRERVQPEYSYGHMGGHMYAEKGHD